MVIKFYACNSELNPIELIWAQIKFFVARENRTYKIKQVWELVEYAMENVISTESWHNAIRHVLKFEQEYWEMDQRVLLDQPLIIRIGESDSDSDTERPSNHFWRPWE